MLWNVTFCWLHHLPGFISYTLILLLQPMQVKVQTPTSSDWFRPQPKPYLKLILLSTEIRTQFQDLMAIVEGNWKGAFGKWLLSFPLFYAFYKIQFYHYRLESLDRNMSPVTWDFIPFCSTSDVICGYPSSVFLMFADWRWHCTAGHNQKQWKCCLS